MSQMRVLTWYATDEEAGGPECSKYPVAEAEADRSSIPEIEGSRYQPLISSDWPAAARGPVTLAPSSDGLSSEDEEGGSDGEETSGSEHWDAGTLRSRGRPESEEEEEEVLPLAPRERRASMRTQTFMDRLKGKRSHKSAFAFHVNHAFKGALFVVAGNLPVLVRPLGQLFPPQFQPLLGGVGLYVVFTVWTNLGETIQFACEGMSGILLATVNQCLVTMVVGTSPESMLAGFFVWLDLITFVWLLLWLNFDGGVRVIALSNHVFFVMLLLKPEDPENPKGLLKTWRLSEILEFRGAQVVNFCIVMAGMALSVIAAVLPTVPILPASDCRVGNALRLAEDETKDLAARIGQLVIDAVKGFGAQQESLVVDGFIAQSMQMHAHLKYVDGWTMGASWEVGLPFVFQGATRLRVVKEMHSILSGVLDNLIILLYTLKYEDFRESHQDMMDEIEIPLDDLAQFFHEELCSAMDALQEMRTLGSRSKSRQKRKTHLITELGEAYFRTLQDMLNTAGPDVATADVQSFLQRTSSGTRFTHTSQRLSTMSTVSKSRNIAVLRETMEESHFVYRMILMVDRLVTRLERQEEDPEHSCSLFDPCVSFVSRLVDRSVLFEMQHLIFAIRQSITIVVCFAVCKHYYHYSAAMVVTQCLLVDEKAHTGSMLKKNLGRLQGVVIGTIFPHLFYDWFSGCPVSQVATLAVILFVFEWIALYVYYSSEDFGYVGCLVGAFGASAMCQGCGIQVNTLRSLYLVMEQNALGIAILTLIDMVFAPQRASDMAYRRACQEPDAAKGMQDAGILSQLQHGLAKAMKVDVHPDALDRSSYQQSTPTIDSAEFSDWSSRTIKLLQTAAKLCDEAYIEPRYMRRPWPVRLYQEVLSVSQGLRVDIVALRDAIEGEGLQVFKLGVECGLGFEDSKEFKRFAYKLHRAFSKVSHMVRLALKHFDEERGEQGKRVNDIHKEAESLKIPTDDDIDRLSRTIVEHASIHSEECEDRGGKGRLSMRTHVLTDTFCRTSVAVCVLRTSTRRLKRLYSSVVDSL